MPGHRHHTLFYKAEWSARPDAKYVRQERWLIPPLDVDAHDELHRSVQYVPTLGKHMMALVKRDYIPLKGDYIGSLEELMFTLDEVSRDHRVTELEAAVGQLTIQALEQQLPYIRDGLILEQ